ncbi:hypothetical protein M0R45_020208 [Rubus argutus]|uniref:F-box domain-containing protein n=1 Tax=Rubus argutus TaxID=59490 RepID=A0AAW1X7N2_RUBAR
MKITELLRHRDPPDRPQKQYAEQEQATVHQKPYLLQLPYRTMVDIHRRIPIKTLIKCRRVCKSWRSLFSHPGFTKDLFSQTPTCHLVIASGRYFLLDFNDASSPNGVAALKTTFHRSSEDIVGSCNGFLCLYKKQLNRHGFYVSNPITGESLLLPKPIKKDDPPPNSCGPSADAITHRTLAFLEATRPKSVEEIVYQSCCAFGFGFSPVSDVYRVVVFTHSRLIEASSPREFVLRSGPRKVMVLTVGSGSWRHIGDSVMCDFDHQSGIYLNGYLHWVGLPTNGSRFIYAFDVESECFQQIPLPPWTLDKNITKCNLGVLNGCLCITVRVSSYINVWVMKDYGVKESWTKELDSSVELHLGFGSSTQSLNFSKERQVLLLQDRLQAHIPGRRGFVGVEVDGLPCSIDAAYLYVPSFVSLKDVIGGHNLKEKRAPKKAQTRNNDKEEAEQELGIDQKPYLLQLPNRAIVDIHCKIPVKTLIQCRRVCKSWHSLFSDPRFTKDLFSRTPTCHLVIASGTYFLLDFNNASCPSGVQALKTSGRSRADIVGSCNGFLCSYKKQLNHHGFYISNPITGESLPLPKPTKHDDPPPISCGPSADANTHDILAFLESTRPRSVEEIVYQSCCAFGFGFSLSDVYKVVLFTHSRLIEAPTPREFVLRSGPRQVMVLTVGSGSWRHIGDSVMCDFDHQSGIYRNGYLHWVGLPTNGSRFIYAFDVERECFQQIPLPPWTLDNNLTKCNLGVLNGCLSITVSSSFNISVWVMKDYGVKESWTKELDIRVDYGLGFGSSAQVLNFSKERQVLLLQNRLQAYIPGRTVKDILRGQNSKGKGYVQADAADHGNADGGQGIVQSVAALVKQKQQERRAPKKAKTTHEAQPMQTSTSLPVHALLSNVSLSSQPTQPSVSLPSTANQFIHPITGINMKTVPCKRKRAPAKK